MENHHWMQPKPLPFGIPIHNLADLCPSCRRAFGHLATMAEFNVSLAEQQHHGSLDELIASANSGCGFCALLCKITEELPQESVIENDKAENEQFAGQLFFRDGNMLEGPTIIELIYYPTWFLPWVYFDPIVFEASNPAFPIIELEPFPDLDMAEHWIKTCVEEHAHNTTLDQLVPTRLIDLMPLDHSEQPKLVLTEANDATSYIYVALSHCWGPQTIHGLTTTATISQYLQAIPHASLPKNFRDAMIVTRRLGYRYIWVDCLCIVQDSFDDWQRECAHMHLVYANAIVTLAVADAPAADCGFLHRREPPTINACVLILPKKDDKPLFLCLRQSHLQDFLWAVRVDIHGNFDPPKTVLDSRAWTMQETLMSQRVLTFGKDQMHFQCDAFECFECCRIPRKPTPERPAWVRTMPTTANRNVELMARDFRKLVVQYTGRFSTHGSDRLPAISAIARRYHDITGDTYLGGLWRGSLIPGLTWHAERNIVTEQLLAPRHTKLSNNGAPTWSWASSDHPVQYFINDPLHEAATVLSASVTPVGLDPFGQVHGGELQLRGFAVECGIATLTTGNSELVCVGTHADFIPEARGYFCRVLLDMESLSGDEPILCLFLGFAGENNSSCWFGLAIQRVEERQCYQRIGLCWPNSVFTALEEEQNYPRVLLDGDNDDVVAQIRQGPQQDFTII